MTIFQMLCIQTLKSIVIMGGEAHVPLPHIAALGDEQESIHSGLGNCTLISGLQLFISIMKQFVIGQGNLSSILRRHVIHLAQFIITHATIPSTLPELSLQHHFSNKPHYTRCQNRPTTTSTTNLSHHHHHHFVTTPFKAKPHLQHHHRHSSNSTAKPHHHNHTHQHTTPTNLPHHKHIMPSSSRKHDMMQ